MRCHVCGGRMEEKRASLPFRLNDEQILIVKQMPVSECCQCGEIVISDGVMAQLDILIAEVDAGAELEIKRYVA